MIHDDPKMAALAERRQEQRGEDLRALMSTEWGRRIAYWQIYELSGVTRRSYNAGIKYGAELSMAHGEGMREVGLELLRLVKETAPDQYLAMMAERIQASQDERKMADGRKPNRSNR